MNYLKPYAVAIASLLAGASVVHNIFKPDLASPDLLMVISANPVSRNFLTTELLLLADHSS